MLQTAKYKALIHSNFKQNHALKCKRARLTLRKPQPGTLSSFCLCNYIENQLLYLKSHVATLIKLVAQCTRLKTNELSLIQKPSVVAALDPLIYFVY